MRISRRSSLNKIRNLFPRPIGETGGQPGPGVSPGSESGCTGNTEGGGLEEAGQFGDETEFIICLWQEARRKEGDKGVQVVTRSDG